LENKTPQNVKELRDELKLLCVLICNKFKEREEKHDRETRPKWATVHSRLDDLLSEIKAIPLATRMIIENQKHNLPCKDMLLWIQGAYILILTLVFAVISHWMFNG